MIDCRSARTNRASAVRACIAIALTAWLAMPVSAQAQWSTTYDQFYLQAAHNWQFRTRYIGADRLFNAFDYGHAVLYETLWTRPDAPASALEVKAYDRLTRDVLVRPPRVPLEEGAIEIRYAQLAPEAKAMFEWAHILHRQLYDVLADERLSEADKDAAVARLLAYYRTRKDLAFSARPKSMALMQGQPYSLAFRQRYPKFNGLIWSYHWLQVGLYEPLLTGRDGDARQLGVRATVARFWQMLGDPPNGFPHQMPMTAAIAPTFAARYPEAAIVFDNLHSMHDVISDILANPSVPRARKRAEILRAARLFRDDTSYVMPVEAWRTMARHMGVENMGGPSVGFLPALPTPTVTYGAAMTHDDRTGAMTGFSYGGAVGGEHAAHAMAATRGTSTTSTTSTSSSTSMDASMDMHAGMHHDASPASASARDSSAVAAAVVAFHAAIAAGDTAAAMAALAPDAEVLESGGLEDRAQFNAHHLAADIAFARAVAQLRGPIRVTVVGEVAWTSASSASTGTFEERKIDSVGVESMVLERAMDGRWLIRSIHWSSRTRRPATR